MGAPVRDVTCGSMTVAGRRCTSPTLAGLKGLLSSPLGKRAITGSWTGASLLRVRLASVPTIPIAAASERVASTRWAREGRRSP